MKHGGHKYSMKLIRPATVLCTQSPAPAPFITQLHYYLESNREPLLREWWLKMSFITWKYRSPVMLPMLEEVQRAWKFRKWFLDVPPYIAWDKMYAWRTWCVGGAPTFTPSSNKQRKKSWLSSYLILASLGAPTPVGWECERWNCLGFSQLNLSPQHYL